MKIPVCSSFRDLGTHLNLSNSTNGTTLTKKMDKATKMVKHLRWMPISTPEKESIIRANILPMALYGCEAAHINDAVFQRMRSAIAEAIGPRSAKACTDLVFEFSTTSKDIDPAVHVLYNRTSALRRVVTKHN